MWFALAAVAHAAPPEIDAESGRPIKYLERQELELEGVELEGELLRPQVQILSARRALTFPPMLQLREHWNEEMTQSVDQVK